MVKNDILADNKRMLFKSAIMIKYIANRNIKQMGFNEFKIKTQTS